MAILVVGATGVVGGEIALQLRRAGHSVAAWCGEEKRIRKRGH